jgi:subfamily B ATP-binding cassette protein MsbA
VLGWRSVTTGDKPLSQLLESTAGAPKSTRYLMGRLWRENISNYTGWIALAVVFMVIVAAATAFSAYLMKPIVDDVFNAKNEDLLWPIALAVPATFLAMGFANYVQIMLMNYVGLKIIADAQNKLFSHLTTLDISFFHNNPTGTLISRFTIDIHLMKVAVSNGVTGVGKELLSLIFLVAVMFQMNWQLAAITFFVFPVAVYPIVRIGRRLRKVSANTQEELGVFATVLTQTFQGIRVVKAYGMGLYESSRVADIVERVRVLNMKAARTRELSRPIMETLAGIAVFVVIIYGGSQVISGETTTGSFFAFIAAFLRAYDPMKRLANLNASIQQGLASAQRLYDVMDRHSVILEKSDAKPLQGVSGRIHLDNVSFSYTEEIKALDGLSIDVPAGETVALVGPSGGGKSTTLNLIPRFYDVDSGSVNIDGIDVRDVTLESLFSNVALVSQEVTLFDDTVRANIAYGRGGASDEEVMEAARNAAAHDFIMDLPDGYETMVGEQGVRLSGGQRQRLAIARAMLKNAPILLLDEATSALDTESERHVQEALASLMKGRTTLVIAHRLSTVIDADNIYVIDKGQVIENGTHDELLAKGGAYKNLYELQFSAEQDADVTVVPAAQQG